MPSEYSCSTCALKVTLGWYHFADGSTGYGAAQQLMCGHCGAPYYIKIALSPAQRRALLRVETRWTVSLMEAGAQPLQVAQVLHHETGCGLREALERVRALPWLLGETLPEAEAHRLRDRFEVVGARVNLLSEPLEDRARREVRDSPAFLPPSDIFLSEVGPSPAAVARLIHEATQCGSVQALKRVRQAPVQLGWELEGPIAAGLVRALKEAGARAHLTCPPPEELSEAELLAMQDALFVGLLRPEGGLDWQPCQVVGERQAPDGRIPLALQTCVRCHARGEFILELPEEVNPCPGCGQRTLTWTRGWVS